MAFTLGDAYSRRLAQQPAHRIVGQLQSAPKDRLTARLELQRHVAPPNEQLLRRSSRCGHPPRLVPESARATGQTFQVAAIATQKNK
jgi:hypothetical protein